MMCETFDRRIKSLERENGAMDDDPIEFDVFLVKPKPDGSMLKRAWPDGKYCKVDPKALGIAPYKAVKHTPKVSEPPVAINVPKAEEYAPAPIDSGEIDAEGFNNWWHGGDSTEFSRRLKR